jgi:heterodisulfide reductase subunit A-like polyferredoxin
MFPRAWEVGAALLCFTATVARAQSDEELLKKDAYDYIIVGGGTSGLTVADRLTENGKCKSQILFPKDPIPLTQV